VIDGADKLREGAKVIVRAEAGGNNSPAASAPTTAGDKAGGGGKRRRSEGEAKHDEPKQ
jgi:multidrug efflux system membrane fusion protein